MHQSPDRKTLPDLFELSGVYILIADVNSYGVVEFKVKHKPLN
jgi:hypothetical protein